MREAPDPWAVAWSSAGSEPPEAAGREFGGSGQMNSKATAPFPGLAPKIQ